MKSFFDEIETYQNSSELKSWIINFEFKGYKETCIGKGNTSEQAIENAIKLNPNGKNFVIATKPKIGVMYGMSTINIKP